MTSTYSLALCRRRAWLLAAACALALGGCASGPNANPRDPFEPFNRSMMQLNESLDAVLLKPTATAYRSFVPPVLRTGVSNFFGNLSDAWSFVNSALQLKLQNAGEDALRVGVNTFFGLGGLLDIASTLNIERHREDFGQTLGRWGVPPGPYLVLPLLGPSTLRDTAALPIDRKGDPVRNVHPGDARNELYLLRAVDARSNLLRASSVLDEAALDKYSFTRDAYLQRRRADIFDNEPADTGGKEPDSSQEAAPAAQEPAASAAPAGQPR
jgi:phospholipid-binding lipoprotein MlaA